MRSDRYYLDPISNGKGYLVLKDFSLWKIKWSGRQGMLVIARVEARDPVVNPLRAVLPAVSNTFPI